METLTIVRVETSTGRGMYCDLWYSKCDLPCDSNHPCTYEDSLYIENLRIAGEAGRMEPSGHRYGFLDLDMLRRWIYNDDWIIRLSSHGAVLCVYEVPADSVIIGRTQITFDFEKAVCLDRKPLASVLE